NSSAQNLLLNVETNLTMQMFILQSNVWAEYAKKYLEFSLKSQQLNPIALILHAQMYSDNLHLCENRFLYFRVLILFVYQKAACTFCLKAVPAYGIPLL
ncbi:hypothetical protein, partial [Kingella kingae]|uniref:hypothetical protein n=2 Tax=Kingella kingae TaxID=504 RepID=UPI001E44C1A8